MYISGPRIAVGNMSDCRNVSDFRARDGKFDPGWFHTFAEIDHEIISTAILLPSADSRKVVSFTNEVLVNCLVKLAQEKSVVR